MHYCELRSADGPTYLIHLSDRHETSGLKIGYSFSDSPFGSILIAASQFGLTRIDFVNTGGRNHDESEKSAIDRLRQLFPDAELHFVSSSCFSPFASREQLPLHLIGSQFQRRVWTELLKIQRGKTASYGEIARRLGMPGAARAVGRAVGANPLPIVVPCHRIVPANCSNPLSNPGNFHYGSALKLKILSPELTDIQYIDKNQHFFKQNN